MFLLLPFPPSKKNMFPVASMSVVALHPLFPEAALGVPGQLPLAVCAGLSAVWRLLSPGLSF